VKALVLSDLHIAFGNYKIRNVDADIILIAGDTCEGWAAANIYEHMCRDGFEIILVAGNHEYYGKRYSEVNDYWRIYFKNKKVPVLPSQINELHEQAKAFLNDYLEQGDILILHHAPSWKSVPKEFVDDPLTSAYVADISELILERKPKLVQHGHIHTSVDYMLGETRGIANPRGYVGRDEYNKQFNPGLVIDIN